MAQTLTAHVLPPLPWAPGALAPVMSEETISYHYGKHHQTYVNKLNELLAGTGLEELPLEELLASLDRAPADKKTAIFNNAAQVWNHTFFWNSLTPGGSKPSAELSKAIDTAFGSMDEFKKQFTAKAVANFGSGWTWLVVGKDGKLAIENTSNAVIPEGKKLLTCDVWEHAYYIDYRNLRQKFVESFWEIANWAEASKRFAA